MNPKSREPVRNGADKGASSGMSEMAFQLEVRDVLDLHTFRPQEISAVVETYLEEARRKGFSTVRIIHGKGIGVQRERVHAVLRRTPFVARFQDGPLGAGGWGATIIWFHAEQEGDPLPPL